MEETQGIVVEAVDFAVPTFYGIGDRFPTWQEAVDAARATIKTTRYPGQKIRPEQPTYHPRRYRMDGDVLCVDTRAFVQQREVEPIQERPGIPDAKVPLARQSVRSGTDGVVRSWEVFSDGTTERRPA